MEQWLQAPRRLLPRCSKLEIWKARRGAKKRNPMPQEPKEKALPSFLVTAQLKRKPTLPISQSCCRCLEALIIPKRSLVDLHVPPRNGFVFILLLKIFSVRLDVKILVRISLMEWVGWAPAITAPHHVDFFWCY